MTAKTCVSCRFWERDETDPVAGACRRRSPLPMLGLRYENILAAIKGVSVEEVAVDLHTDLAERTVEWPVTMTDDWCGEWGAIPQ